MKDKRIEKFRRLADNMQESVDNKMNPATASQNLTPRRVRVIESMRQDGEKLEKIQAILRGIAEDLECGREPLVNAKSKKDVESWLYTKPEGLERYLTKPSEEEIRNRELRKIEMDLVGRKIPGFFPTPKNVIERVFELADIKGDSPLILEPSAGRGCILDYIRERIPHAGFLFYEINTDLVKILELKGWNCHESDFLDSKPIVVDYTLMNPPFEKFADIHHVRHAYKFLKTGGRLVSIMSEGIFFRNNKICEGFREFIKTCGYSEKLDTGSFKGVGSFRQTGVNCRIVVLDKSEGL